MVSRYVYTFAATCHGRNLGGHCRIADFHYGLFLSFGGRGTPACRCIDGNRTCPAAGTISFRSRRGLAAAAAHELGTPLVTIQVAVRELQHQLGPQTRFCDNLELLISQTRRCRDILQKLTSLATKEGGSTANFSLRALIEEVAVPHRDFGIDIEIRRGEKIEPDPVFYRNPGILYGLGNLVENAVDFACHKVFIDYRCTEKHIAINVLDDGAGFAPISLTG